MWPAEILEANPDYRGKSLFDVLYANGKTDAYGLDDIDPDYANSDSQALGFYIQKGLFEEYAEFGRGKAHDLAPFATSQRASRAGNSCVAGQCGARTVVEGDPSVHQRPMFSTGSGTRWAS